MQLDVEKFYSPIQTRQQAVKSACRGLNYRHLTDDDARALSEQFCRLTGVLLHNIGDSPELTLAIQRLREAKDRAITAYLWVKEDLATEDPGHGIPTPPGQTFIETYPKPIFEKDIRKSTTGAVAVPPDKEGILRSETPDAGQSS